MPSLGLKNSVKSSVLSTPGIIRDNLVLKHDYIADSVIPVSDGAASFDGTDDYIRTGFIPNYIHTNATSAFWVNMRDFNSSQVIGCHNSNRWYMGFSSTGGFLGVQGANNSASPITITPTPVANQWMHYAVVANGGTATLYINAVAQGTLSYTQDAAENPDTEFIIGASQDSSGNLTWAELDGYICNLGQWNVALTQAQIKSIMWKNYTDLTDSEKTNLQAWWNLDSNLTTDGNKSWISDNHDETFGSNITPTWSVGTGSPTIDAVSYTHLTLPTIYYV